MMLQTILYGTFMPPPVSSKRVHYINDYPTATLKEKIRLPKRKQVGVQGVFEAIKKHPGITGAELSALLKISATQANAHAKTLADGGLVRTSKGANAKRGGRPIHHYFAEDQE